MSEDAGSLSFELNGTAPELSGQVCEGFVCQALRCEGKEASAHISYLQFNGTWHRLYFEYHIVFWRPVGAVMNPWDLPVETSDIWFTDVGTLAGIIDQKLASYEMLATERGSKVAFHFAKGRSIVIEDRDDLACYSIVQDEAV